MEPIVSIHVDLLLIGRCFATLSWGIIYAFIIQHTRQGQFLAAKRTWLSVVIGVGVDLAIAYNADWWTVFAVIACSAVGIISRSLLNESNGDNFNANSYKMKHNLEDGIASLNKAAESLESALMEKNLGYTSQGLAFLHRGIEYVKAARRGGE